MTKKPSTETSPLTKSLLEIDWAERFEAYDQYQSSTHNETEKTLKTIEQIVKKSLGLRKLPERKNISQELGKYEENSREWHCLCALVKVMTIRCALESGLGSTASLNAIQCVQHIWLADHGELLEEMEVATTKTSDTNAEEPVIDPSSQAPSSKTTKPASPVRRKAKSTKKADAGKENVTQLDIKKKRTASANDKETGTNTIIGENVVLRQMVGNTPDEETSAPPAQSVDSSSDGDAGSAEDDRPLSERCQEIADELAVQYPEYTLTAIRVMTAEKLGVSRQYVDNLDITPARFKKNSA